MELTAVEFVNRMETNRTERISETGWIAQVENIFTSWASSAVLTQDLLDIQRLEHELGMEVEAVEDNIFHWKARPLQIIACRASIVT